MYIYRGSELRNLCISVCNIIKIGTMGFQHMSDTYLYSTLLADGNATNSNIYTTVG